MLEAGDGVGGINCGFELIGGEVDGLNGYYSTLTDGVGHAWGEVLMW
jgi:hypothetical protein